MNLRALLLLLLVLFPSLAKAADTLEVTLLFPAGQPSVTYTLNATETRQFWLRWNELPRTTNMVPVTGNDAYKGIRIRVDSDREIRLNSGVGTMGTNARIDDMRVLERWLLTKAPSPPGEDLIAQLDQQVDQLDPTRPSVKKDKPTAQALISRCRVRAENNKRLRARCLADALLENREPDEAIDALQEALRAGDPTAPKLGDLPTTMPTPRNTMDMPQGRTIMMPHDETPQIESGMPLQDAYPNGKLIRMPPPEE